MIDRLVLRNWKSYEALSIDFVAGCNFLIAENGVGKTGLIQALYFGLFGDGKLLGSRSPAAHAIRGGAREAHVELMVRLGEQLWSVHRVLRRDGGIDNLFEADGVDRAESDWLGRLAAESLVDAVQLRLLCAIPEGASSPAELDAQDRYDLVAHLSSVLGATKLTALADQYQAESVAVAKEADKIRLTERDRPSRESSRRLETLQENLESASAAQETARNTLAECDAVVESHRRWAEWAGWAAEAGERAESALLEWGPLINEAGRLSAREVQNFHLDVPEVREPEQITRLLRRYAEAREEAGRLVGELRELYRLRTQELAALEAQAAASSSSIDLLSEPGAICPTCLRPMSDAEREEATTRNRARITELRPAIDDLRRGQEQIAGLGRRVAAVTDAPILDARPAPTDPLPPVDREAADEALRLAEEAFVARAAEVRRLEEEVRGTELAAERLAENDALSKRLVEMYRRSDICLMASMTFRRVADTICTGRLEPLATELAKRWNEIWPNRPKLELDQHGALMADAGGAKLNLVDLSGGERAVAMILLRILAAQAASQCPFLLLDEPLEHLDPANRRTLANLLAAAGRSDAQRRQLIVTTYEETVARRLGRADDTEVVYVRTARR
ncbi:AAA family ATPase [Kribbella sp. NPDC003505]|uniref:AAA family ATPase n=1 Tax=Kribbella sp. NPDC003505 TaxID=3154448 RepID=UPI0033B4424B